MAGQGMTQTDDAWAVPAALPGTGEKPAMTWLVAAGAFLLFLPLAILNTIPENDLAERYIFMVQAALDGEWALAFHPRVPPAFPLFASAIAAVSGLAPFMACKLASLLAFSLAVVPLFHLLRQVFGKGSIAWWGVGAYLLCSYLSTLAFAGLRETLAALALLVYAYGLTGLASATTPRLMWTALTTGAVLLSLTRIDGLLFVLAGWGVLVAGGLAFRRLRRRLPGILLSLLVFCLPLGGWLGYCWSVTGYPVPDARLAPAMNNVFRCLGLPQPVAADSAPRSAAPATPDAPVVAPDAAEAAYLAGMAPRPQENRRWCEHLLKGLYVYFLLFAVPAVFWRLRAKQWTAAESVLLALAVLYPLLLVLEITAFSGIREIDRRYLLPGVPLYLGWTAAGARAVYRRWLAGRPRLAAGILAALALISLWDSMNAVLRTHGLSSRRTTAAQATLQTANWLSAHLPRPHYAERRMFDPQQYRGGLIPVVFTTIPAAAALGGYCPASPERFRKYPATETAGVLVVWNRECAGIPPRYQPVFSTGDTANDLTVFRIVPSDREPPKTQPEF